MSKGLIFVVIIATIIIGIFACQFLIKKWGGPFSQREASLQKAFMPDKTTVSEETQQQAQEQKSILGGKKIALIIASRDFKDEEYFTTKEVLEQADAQIVTVSDSPGTAIGSDGGETEVDIVLDDLDIGGFHGIIFIGGPGALKHLDNEKSYRIAQQISGQEKILGAICIAPVILAKAGVLKGKQATVWSSLLDKSPVKTLEENGAIYKDQDIVVDGNTITANGPAAAERFGERIVELILLLE